MAQIPESVARQVLRAIETIRRIAADRQRYFDLDTNFGGDGRYESEYWESCQPELKQAERVIGIFREHAPQNGVDAEAQIAAWGGVPGVFLSSRGQRYLWEGVVHAANH